MINLLKKGKHFLTALNTNKMYRNYYFYKITLVVLFSCIILFGCSKDAKFLDSMITLEKRQYRGEKIPIDRINDLKKEINRYEKDIRELAFKKKEIGTLYKLLASNYLNEKMFNEAVFALDEAIKIDSENPILFYLKAVATARLAKSIYEVAARIDNWEKAVWSYNRALEIDPSYVDALYGLSVLYVYELGRGKEAESLLEKILELERKNIDAMFVRAAMFVNTERTERAIEQYDQIIEISSTKKYRKQALENKQLLESRYKVLN